MTTGLPYEVRTCDGRRIAVLRRVERAETQFYDCDYAVDLGSVPDDTLAFRQRNGSLPSLLSEACREPTSLELLYYAQVGGPHVNGSAL